MKHPNDQASPNHSGAKPKRRRTVLKYVVLTSLAVCSAALIPVLYIVFGRALPLYREMKSSTYGWVGNVHSMDSELGYVPIPGSSGTELVPFRAPLGMRYDQNGLRIPVSGIADVSIGQGTKPIILTLGCSVTYGAVTPAEQTYPFYVGSALEGTTRNAGRCAYGLSQMFLMAKKLIPAIKPDILIVQYSPWLAARAQSPVLFLKFGKIGQPYFYGENAELHEPPFRGIVLDLPTTDYRGGESSFTNFLSFLGRVAFPLAITDGYNLASYKARLWLDILPAPTADKAQIERVFWNEIVKLAKDYKAELVAVAIGGGDGPVKQRIEFPESVLYVDANQALIDRLPEPDLEHWVKEYVHWAGEPPRVVDYHPNAVAHKIIADEIVAALKTSGSEHVPENK
jgi:hypothetical protein